MDWWSSFFSAIMDHIFVPIIIAFGAAVLLVLKTQFDKIAKSIVAKNELASMEKKSSIRKELFETIDQSVEAAVASNMQIAEEMKRGGEKLTDQQIKDLNRSAKQLIINSLPVSLTSSDGVLCEIIGGRDKLDAIIDAMMEKHVYEFKVKKLQNKNGTSQPAAQTSTSTQGVPTRPKIPTRPVKR